MDVKVGRRVWDDFAEQDKIEREKKKYPPQEIIGFRIIGMRVSGLIRSACLIGGLIRGVSIPGDIGFKYGNGGEWLN